MLTQLATFAGLLVMTSSLCCAAPLVVPQQATAAGATAPQQHKARKILKREVDGLVRLLRGAQRENGALGDGTCRSTAKALTAAGHCHRFYHRGDGPWLRQAIHALFGHRRADSSFRDDGDDDAAAALTTAWVIDALAVMDPQAFSEEIAAARRFLDGAGAGVPSPFRARLGALRAAMPAGADPADAAERRAAEALAKMPRGYPMDADGRPDPAAAADAAVLLVACQVIARGDDQQDAAKAPPRAWSETQARGFAFLLRQQRDGVFVVRHGGREFPDVGLTGIGLAALQTKPASLRTAEENKTITKGLTWLAAQQDKEGAFGQQNVNYSTCAAVMALKAADDARYEDNLRRAQRFVLFLQNVEERGYGRGDRDYGSIGYGGDERGDLSNLQFSLQALRETGLSAEHEAFKKALVFLQRTQNLRKVNDLESQRTRDGDTGKWYEVAPGNDGGASYYPGNSPAGYVELADGTRIPRSYGSMTYALLKAYTMCGLPATDPRVQAAVAWIGDNWTLDVNPGADPKLGEKTAYQGLYYYYMVMAQALAATGMDKLKVTHPANGDEPARTMAIDWREQLAEHLAGQQREDGSWLNERNGRWWEDQPLVCTVYAMLALERCR